MKLPQLTLRELFLLVVIAAMGCGWWVDRLRAQERLKAESQKAVEVGYERGRWKWISESLKEYLERSGEIEVNWDEDHLKVAPKPPHKGQSTYYNAGPLERLNPTGK